MDDRKTRSERILTEDFLLTYNLIHHSSFDIVRAGDPPEPDMICRDTRSSQQLGVEVTVVYYDSTHAKSLWEPARGKTAKPYFLSRQDSEYNEAFIGKIADRVKQKSRKVYSFSGKLLLIVFVEAIRFYIQDVIEELESVVIPGTHPFKKILVFSHNAELYQLYPVRESLFGF